MDLALRGKVAIVTAASRGLGKACAQTLVTEGMAVVMAARDAETLDRLVAELTAQGGEALALPCDISDPAVPESMVAAALERWGRLDALVVSTPGPPLMACMDLTEEVWSQAMEMNCTVPIRLTQAVLPTMRASGGGRIVYIGTIGTRMVQPGMVLSNATRLALVGYAKTLSLEVAADNVLVNTVAPGPLATERMDDLASQMAARLGISHQDALQLWVDEVPLARMGRPQDLANIVALLVSEASCYVTGAVIPIDGGKAPTY
ncbi:MAG: SDR family oxidoreductase [Candidatus Dormibacteria bacterium]